MLAERRRHLRHKVHSPAYASIGTGIGGVVLDAHDRGAAIESIARLTPQSFVELRLDLLDTRGSAVTPARVAWCDEGGRVGLEFLNLTGESRRQLQQWLLLNALLATENAGELTQAAPPEAPNGELPKAPPRPQVAGAPEFQRVVERALACTEANGAAIALANGETIVCLATAGEIVPPPGTKLDAQSGISGACVRSGRWLRCDDPGLDPHVDRETCQALGISSVLAVPVGERGDILGLIEVFSRAPYAFRETHCAALQELAKAVALSLRPEMPQVAPPPAAATEPVREEAPTPPPLSTPVEVASSSSQFASAAAAVGMPPATPASDTPILAVPTSGPALAPGAAPAKGHGERLMLLGLLAMLVVLGVWLLLDRGAGGSRSVDAAEPAPIDMQNPQQPATAVQGSSAPATPSVTADLSGSIRPLHQQAEAGDAEAEFELGARYASGEDVAQDYGQAVKWFTRAANDGQVLAAATLGAYYWAGRGVAQADVSAYMWSAIAREGGDEASKYRLAILRARMTGAQIGEAEQRAAAWRRTHAHRPPAGRNATQP
jgi:putative methionine-R-sulfoxide reductase with GAF domain